MSKRDEKLLRMAREQYKLASDASANARHEAELDLKIYEGEGIWDEQLKNRRINDPKGARPCLTVSDLPPRCRQIMNDVRMNKPSIKMRPVDSAGDVDTAAIFDGIVRHIEQQSMADIAYETGNFYQTVTGLGYLRLVDGHSPETSEHELFIRAVPNPDAVRIDPASLCPVASTARFAFITEDIPREEFEREYGRKDVVDFDSDDTQMTTWVSDEFVKVAEWMNLEEIENNRILTEDGEFGEEEYFEMEERKPVIGTRMDRRLACVWRKITGNRILKEIELPIPYVPVIRVPGEMYVKDGRIVYKGLVRDSRDAVRMVSYTFSAYIESITVQTKTPYIGAAGQFDGYETDWANSNVENAPYLEYNPTDVEGKPVPAPRREPPPMASMGIIQGLALAKDALKDTSGMGAASLGQKGNEISGRAIMARQREGDVGSHHYSDNLSKAMRYMGRILVKWIPKVYNERNVTRILGEDDESSMVYLDSTQQTAKREVPYTGQMGERKIRKIYNLGVGNYDVIATVGPSYSTKRVETSEFMAQLFQTAPETLQLIGDIYFENQDTPGAQRMARRFKAMLPPQAAQADAENDETQLPPHIVAQMQQMQGQLQEAGQLVQALQEERTRLEAELSNKDNEVQAKLAAVHGSLDQAKIKALADLNIAQIEAESRERIAGLQAQIDRMQQVMDVFLSAVQDTGVAGETTTGVE